MAKTVNYNSEGIPDSVPTFLVDFAETYQESPRDACREWFARATMGLSVFFGLHSLVGRGEHVCADTSERGVPPEQYMLLPDMFTCEHFDAVDIVELAIATGARYIVFPARFRDGFCLFSTATTDFNSVKSKANRDLVGELSSVCEFYGLGFCLTFSLGHDYHQFHVNGLPDDDARKRAFLDMAEAQLHELLDNYGPYAAIRFEGIEAISRDDAAELYKLVRHLQPQILISCQQGLTGTEDIFAPGTEIPSPDAAEDVQGFVHKDTSKPIELLLNLTPGKSSFHAESAGAHVHADDLWKRFTHARRNQATFLVNTALMPDGSLDLEDMNELLAIGKRIETNGYPA